MSALIFDGKSDNEPYLTERLQAARDHLTRVTLKCGEIQMNCGM